MSRLDAPAPPPARGLGSQSLRFAVAGVLGLGVDTAVLYGLMALGLDFPWARALSFLAAATFTWGFNRRHTFGVHAEVAPSWGEWARYLLAMAGGGLVNYLVSLGAYQQLELVRAYPVLALALGSLVGMVFNFFSARHLVFRRAK